MKNVRIKVNANRTFEMSNFGRLNAEDVLKDLFDNEHISKIETNVTESLENMLYDGYSIKKATYDTLVNEVE